MPNKAIQPDKDNVGWGATEDYFTEGMTQRNHIAVEAMKALIGRENPHSFSSKDYEDFRQIAKMAYQMADAMIDESREQEEDKG